MRKIPLHSAKAAGRVALVDDEKYELVNQYRWYLWEETRPGRRNGGPYAVTNIKRNDKWTIIRMHTLLTGYAKTDHINNNGLDNQLHNLRTGPAPLNGANRRKGPRRANKTTTSPYKGVSKSSHPHRIKTWKMNISVNGRRQESYFALESDAARAYDAAAWKAWGSYAWLNFPEDYDMPPHLTKKRSKTCTDP